MRARLAPSIMGNVGELTAKRVDELLLDKKVLVRVLAETVSAAALTDEQTEKFNKTLADAGYPAKLIHGPDPILEKRVHEMLETLADEVIAEMTLNGRYSQAKVLDLNGIEFIRKDYQFDDNTLLLSQQAANVDKQRKCVRY